MYGSCLCAPSDLLTSLRPYSKSVIMPAALEWPFPPLTPQPLCWVLLTIWKPRCDSYTWAQSQTHCSDRNTLSQSGSSWDLDLELGNPLGFWISGIGFLPFSTSRTSPNQSKLSLVCVLFSKMTLDWNEGTNKHMVLGGCKWIVVGDYKIDVCHYSDF